MRHARTVTHYSRLSKIVVDVPAEAHDAEVAFWGQALGVPLTRFERFPEYHGASLATDGLGFLVQHLGDGTPGVHIDIHTTDRAAEVARLERIGATLVDDGEHWTIMRDPAGLLFCVIPDPRLNESNAQRWSD
jgi:catechol 2,3-dioxygenase-like lactoylglutathione lyase family enzyme